MAEYIERDALRQAVLESQHDNSHPRGWAHIAHDCEHAHFVAMIDRFPAADVAPVVHGRIVGSLEDGRYRRRFSCCGEDATMITQWVWPKYCPNCGAKMDGGADNA
nr:MAG TPA: NADH-PPase NADH pyrophosphatase zinc ribbon domain [Caudoviricetes sp.]